MSKVIPKLKKLSENTILRFSDLELAGIWEIGFTNRLASAPPMGTHYHSHALELCHLLRGYQKFRIGDRSYDLKGGDQFFTQPDEKHDTGELLERGELVWIILPLEESSSILGLDAQKSEQLRRMLLDMPVRHFQAHPECAHLILSTIACFRERSTAHWRMDAVTSLLRYLVLTAKASQNAVSSQASPVIQRCVNYVIEHLEEKIPLEDLARVARLSVPRLKTRFRMEMGMPPAEFMLRQRLERSKEMLRDKSVTTTAYALGFSSTQNFATAFRRYHSMSPSEFQTQVRSCSRSGDSLSSKPARKAGLS